MGLVTMIVNFNNSHHIEDAIHYIQTNQTRIRVSDLNDALDWAGKKPSDYRDKDSKIEALLDYLNNEYKD